MKIFVIILLICTGFKGEATDSLFINVRDYGAIGDGISDDTQSIQDALAYAKTLNGGIVYLPQGIYKIRRSLYISSNTTLRGAGAAITKITKGASIRSLLTANANINATSVTVANSSGFNIGDAINIADNSSFEWLSTQGVITDIIENVITFDNGLDGNLQTARAAFVSTSFPLFRNDSSSYNISVANLTIDQNANSNDPSNEFTISTIHWEGSYNSIVENCYILNSASDAYSDQAQDGSGILPSINIIKSTNNIFRNNVIHASGRHGVHLGTCMDGALITGNKITSCKGMALFYCAFVTNTIAENNLVDSCSKGFAGGDLRDSNNIISNNVFRNCTSWVIEPGSNGIVSNNIITNCSKGILVQYPNISLSNNYISLNAGGENISVVTGATNCTIIGGHLIGKVIGGTSLFVNGASNLSIDNLIIVSSYRSCDIRGVTNMRVINSPILSSTTSQGWIFQVAQSTDVSIDLKGTLVTTPVVEIIAPIRVLYNGMGTNGTTDPSMSGNWFLNPTTVANKKYDGAIVQWNNGTEHLSIFKQGIGWIGIK